jgi:hypothetical protein
MDTAKSEAMLEYERRESELFDRLARGEITMSEYQMNALDVVDQLKEGFNDEELLTVSRVALRRHGDVAAALAELGHPRPGNDPKRPN